MAQADAESKLRVTAEDATKQAFDAIKAHMVEVEAASSKLSGALAGLGIVTAGLSAAGFGEFIKRGIDATAALDDLSEKTGASVEELSKLQQVARIGGHDFGIVETFLVKMNKALHETDEEAKGANRALKAIGLSAAQLRDKDPGEALKIVADKLATFKDSGSKTAAILALTGKSAAEALPFLKDLAQETGIVSRVTAEQAAQAEELQKSLKRLSNATTEAGNAFARDMVPGLTRVVEQFATGKEIAGGFFKAILLFGSIDPFKSTGENIKAVSQRLEELGGKRDKFIQQGRTGWIPTLDAEIDRLQKQKQFLEFQQRQQITPVGRGRLDAKDLGPTSLDNLDKPKETGKKDDRFDTAIKQLEQEALKVQDLTRLDEIRAQVELGHYGKLTQAQRDRLDQLAAEVDINRGNEAARKQDIELQKEIAALVEASNVRGTERLNAEDERLTKLKESYIDLIDPIEKYRKKLDEVDQLLEKELINIDQANAARLAIDDQIQAAAGMGKVLEDNNDVVKQLGLTFQSAFEDAVVGGKKLREVLQGIAQDVARVILRKGVTEPLADAVIKSDAAKSIGDFFKGLFGGARAGGGDVSAGRAYLVGERGPELFVPRASGSVVPNGAGSTININITGSAQDAQAIAAAVVPAVRSIVRGELGNQLRPGGAFNPA